MKSVPHLMLYGAAQRTWMGLVHYERIPERSALFDWEIDPHVHDALIQVLYPVRGGGEVLIDGVKWVLHPPAFIVAPAGSVHGFRFHADIDGPVITAAQRPLESLAAAAAPELLRHIRKPTVVSVDASSRHAEALLPLFDAIERESATHAAGQEVAGLALMLSLFVQIARISDSVPRAEEPQRSRKAVQIERFRALLDQRLKERLPVEWYAEALGVSAGQLTRLCREVLGMSTLDAITPAWCTRPQRELVYSSLSVKQVAAELGFDDEAYFGRFFKKQTGQRPTEFRAMARQQLAAT